MVDGAIVAKHDINFYSEKEVLNLQLFTDNLFASSGQFSGYSVVHKFGHNTDVATNYETLWSFGATYSYLSSATLLKLSSSDTNDDDGDTGARTVLVQGLDSDYNEIEETVTLNGQLAVDTQNQYLRVFRMIVKSVGSSGYNEGIVYAGTGTVSSGVPANVYAEIPAGYNQTMMAVYTVPANKTGYMTMFYAQPDDNKGFQTRLLTQEIDGIMRIRNQLHSFQSQSNFNYLPYLKVNEKTDLQIQVKIDQGTPEFGGGFSLILVDND